MIVALFVLAGGSGPAGSPTTAAVPPPEGEAEILESARQLTRQQEGLRLRPYHPVAASGVSIGYGYDMRERSAARVASDLSAVEPPIRPEWIATLSAAAGLTGDAAQAFLDAHGIIFLSPDQADSLFDITYAEETAIAREFATMPGTLADLGTDYPAADWDALHPAIRGVLIDLKFRGDYRPWWPVQQDLQRAVASNDPSGVLGEISDPTNFPADLAGSQRFNARMEWLRWVLGVEKS